MSPALRLLRISPLRRVPSPLTPSEGCSRPDALAATPKASDSPIRRRTFLARLAAALRARTRTREQARPQGKIDIPHGTTDACGQNTSAGSATVGDQSASDVPYDGMTCGDCCRPFSEVMDFLVSDVIWNFVMAGQDRTTLTIRAGLYDGRLQPRSEGVGGVVCLSCFDKRAKEKGIEYRKSLVVLGVECWMGASYTDGMPT